LNLVIRSKQSDRLNLLAAQALISNDREYVLLATHPDGEPLTAEHAIPGV